MGMILAENQSEPRLPTWKVRSHQRAGKAEFCVKMGKPARPNLRVAASKNREF